MAIKKSELYSSLWASCDELRGGMDASLYKDYVLTMLFVKYVSDKYADDVNALIEIPKGASFKDMVALKGQPDLGDQINKKILRPLFAANELDNKMELVDFNDEEKLGSGKDMVDRLSKLIAIFENPALDFRNNRAEDDDILGDAYEYLMRHFATESGKSKGQFYTPAEVSRVLAKIIGVERADRPSYTVYDPTCGSGSLLLKVAGESDKGLSVYGQEMDIATKSLAIMNMWLHGYPEAEIAGRNTISTPQFKEKDGSLKRFDFVVANPPFSTKNWSTGLDPASDIYNRFSGYGIPPDKNGDYAFLLHIIASLKSDGTGAVILPHGVLFRGNAEAQIRKNLIDRRLIKGIIGLPANLFYGTGIPACIIVVDKRNAENRESVFMVDASKGFIKDGNKNRLREQDLHKIVDIFNKELQVDKYSRYVTFEEIEQNEYNLNLPRYVDTQEDEDIQDLDAHLNGGIPLRDIDALDEYWKEFPSLRQQLFNKYREDYARLNVTNEQVREMVFSNADFEKYKSAKLSTYNRWKTLVENELRTIDENTAPKKLIHSISEKLLDVFANDTLISQYAVYQHLMDYWASTMKDDCYLVVEGGWSANAYVVKKSRTETIYNSELIPRELLISLFLNDKANEIQELEAKVEELASEITQMEEEHAGDEGIIADACTDKGKLTQTSVKNYLKEIKNDPDEVEAIELLELCLQNFNKSKEVKAEIKVKTKALNEAVKNQYDNLTTIQTQNIIVDNKWFSTLESEIATEVESIAQKLANRIKELADRYDETLNSIEDKVDELEVKVKEHLEKMGLKV